MASLALARSYANPPTLPLLSRPPPPRSGKWSYEGIGLNGDIALEDYIAVKAKDAVYLPHSASPIRGAAARLRRALRA